MIEDKMRDIRLFFFCFYVSSEKEKWVPHVHGAHSVFVFEFCETVSFWVSVST